MDAAIPVPSRFGRCVALACVLGCAVGAGWSGAAPTAVVALPLLALGVALWAPSWRMRAASALRGGGALLFGLAAFWLHAAAGMTARIPPALEDVPVDLVGRVVGLPEHAPDRQRFEFVAESALVGGEPRALDGVLRLSLYRSDARIGAGQRLALRVKLRRPRALRNPGGFDFERTALERGLVATGYVLEWRVLSPQARGVDAWRERLSGWIAARVADPAVAALLRALAVGDQGAVPDALWDRFRATGTTHLVAISGFHVGMVGAALGLCVAGVFRLVPRLALRWPRRQAVMLAGGLGAASYAVLAGPSLPVLRTVAMIAVAVFALLLRRHVPLGRALALAALVVLVPMPLAVLNAGFWLSFGGVFWLLVALGGRSTMAWWSGYARAQWVAFVALTPLAVAWFQSVSLSGPLVNAIAIPWVSFGIVPLLLAACGLSFVSPSLAGVVLDAAAWLAEGYLWMLAHAEHLPLSTIGLPAPDVPALLLALAGGALALLPRGVPGRLLAPLLWLPLLWPRIERPPPGQFDLTVLDVGQGLSVLVRTAGHDLLYDTGPSRPAGLDSGEAIVVPVLRQLGAVPLEHLVVSHADNDHAGGAASVVRLARPARVEGGPGTRLAAVCASGSAWSWDGVAFEILHPPPFFPDLGNEGSCVLRIAAGGQAALLPGDVSSLVESRLLALRAPLSADVLVLGHHGSRHSSSPAFLAAVGARIAVASAGDRNRFGHPHPEVVARLRDAGAALVQTARAGAVRVRVGGPGGPEVVSLERHDTRRAWSEP
jgi:competence protein ComEC